MEKDKNVENEILTNDKLLINSLKLNFKRRKKNKTKRHKLNQLYEFALANYNFATALNKVGITTEELVVLNKEEAVNIKEFYETIKLNTELEINKALRKIGLNQQSPNKSALMELLKNDSVRQMNTNLLKQKTKQPEDDPNNDAENADFESLFDEN